MAGRIGIGLRVPVLRGALARPDTVSTPGHLWTTPKWFDRCLVALIPLMVLAYLCGFMVNYGPSMSHLGWVYQTSWGTQPTRVGQIVRFAQPGQPAWHKFVRSSIKRVAAITPTGFWLEGDNTENSQDSRDWKKAVPPDHVAGVVTACWSPRRMMRSWSAEGRWQNSLEWSVLPRNLKPSSDGQYLVVQREDRVELLRRGSLTPLASYPGTLHQWADNQSFRLITPDLKLRLVKVDGTEVSLAKVPTSVGFAGSSLTELAFDGDASVKVGDSLELPDHKATVRVVGIRRFVCGGPEGFATVAKLDRALSRQPMMGDKVHLKTEHT